MIIGACIHVKMPITLFQLFVETCRSLFLTNKDSISLEVLAVLVAEAIELNKSKPSTVAIRQEP
jgi:hypothetical protein